MLEWKRRFALSTWFGLLAFLGCSGGGSNQPTPSKASYTFSPASIAGTVNDGNLVCSADKGLASRADARHTSSSTREKMRFESDGPDCQTHEKREGGRAVGIECAEKPRAGVSS